MRLLFVSIIFLISTFNLLAQNLSFTWQEVDALLKKVDSLTASAQTLNQLQQEMYDSLAAVRADLGDSEFPITPPILASVNTTSDITISWTGTYDSVQIFGGTSGYSKLQTVTDNDYVHSPPTPHVNWNYYGIGYKFNTASAHSDTITDFTTRNWYAGTASSGDASGSSWDNKRILSSFGWTTRPVLPGDTVFVDGGSGDSLVYTLAQQIQIDALYGLPNKKIVITRGQDAGHDGLPVLTRTSAGSMPWCHIYMINSCRDIEISYLKFNGRPDTTSFTPLTAMVSVGGGSERVDIMHNTFVMGNDNNCLDYKSYKGKVMYNNFSTSINTRMATDFIHTQPQVGVSPYPGGHEIAYNYFYNSNQQLGSPTLGHKDHIQWGYVGTEGTNNGDTTLIHHNAFINPVATNYSYQTVLLEHAHGRIEFYNNVFYVAEGSTNDYINNFSISEPAALDSGLHVYFYNNTSYYGSTTDKGNTPFSIWGAETLVMKNNIFDHGFAWRAMAIDGKTLDSGYVNIDYNIYYNNGESYNFYLYGAPDDGKDAVSYTFAEWKSLFGFDTNSYFGQPTYVNAGGTTAASYALAYNSAYGIDDGIPLTLVTDTYDGVSRYLGDGWDIGAFEFTGNNIYVSNQTVGTGTGTSWANAMDLYDLPLAFGVGGDTVYVDGGTDSLIYNKVGKYYATVGYLWQEDGIKGRKIVITRGKDAGHNGIPKFRNTSGTAGNIFYLEDASYLEFSYLHFDTTGASTSSPKGQLVLYSAHNIDVFHNDFNYCRGTGLEINTADTVNVMYNNFYTGVIDNLYSNDAIHSDGGVGGSNEDIVIAHNTFKFQNTQTGHGVLDLHTDFIQLSRVYDDVKIYNNFFYGAGGQLTAILLEYLQDTSKIYNNIIDLSGVGSASPGNGSTINSESQDGTGIILFYNNTVSGGDSTKCSFENFEEIHVKNNLFKWTNGSDRGSRPYVYQDNGDWTKVKFDYNIYEYTGEFIDGLTWLNWYNTSTYGYQDAHSSISGYTVLSEPSDDPLDYKLSPGSEGIDDGVVLGSPYNVDYEGITRPVGGFWDIGAFER